MMIKRTAQLGGRESVHPEARGHAAFPGSHTHPSRQLIAALRIARGARRHEKRKLCS
jgi:hypothetical protein